MSGAERPCPNPEPCAEHPRVVKTESFSVLMARALRVDASAARAMGCMLLGAELAADWSRVAEVRRALAESALTLEASALRVDPAHDSRPWHLAIADAPGWGIACAAEEPSMRATKRIADVTCADCLEAARRK